MPMTDRNSVRRIPVLASRFLGSGKTTLVRWLLEQAQATGVRLAVVTNDFGSLGIDQALSAVARPPMSSSPAVASVVSSRTSCCNGAGTVRAHCSRSHRRRTSGSLSHRKPC
jgi:Ni2+-binding GTPase involved in maturation of urease and hydrogenase